MRRMGFSVRGFEYLRAVLGSWGKKLRAVGWRISYRFDLLTGHRSRRSVQQVLFLASIRYRPKPYPGKLVVFRSSVNVSPERRRVTLQQTERVWGSLASELEIHEIPGDHITMMHEPNVERLAEKLTCYLQSMPAVSRGA
jgi:hypothetical protein